MTVNRQPWFQKWYARLRHESTFLPKRLVLITFLLFVLYIALLLRSQFSGRPFGIGLVDVDLQSKLFADYDRLVGPAAPFAPLELAIIEAKLRDENPYLSEEAVSSLVRAAMAAVYAPIVTTTPTPGLYTQTVLKAAIVVSGSLALGKPVATVTLFQTGKKAMPLASENTSMGQVAFEPPPDAPTRTPEESSPTQVVDTEITRVIPSISATTLDLAAVNLAVGDATGEATLAPTIATNIAIVVMQPTLSQPLFAEPMTPTPFDTLALVATTPTNWPKPLGTPTPINTPTEVWTATSFATVTPTPLVTPTIMLAVTPTATSIPTATPIAFAPVVTTDPPIGMATTAPTVTATPISTATPSPTATSTITPTVSAPPIIINLTAHVENDKVYLAWPPSSAKEVIGYHLYRSTINLIGDTVRIDERINAVLLSVPFYVDTAALDGSQYAYGVTAVNQWNLESLPSTAVTVTMADQTAPHAPIQFSASLNGSQIQLRWQANEELDLAGYNVYRSNRLPIDKTGGPTNGASLLTTSSYLDTIVLDGQTYYYSFTAVDRAGNESLSSIETQMPTIDLVAPAPPAGLKVTLQGTTAVVEWQANQETDIAGYRLYRALALPVDLTLAPLHSEPLLATQHYEDQTIQPGSYYYYVLVAVDVHQNRSAASAAVTFP